MSSVVRLILLFAFLTMCSASDVKKNIKENETTTLSPNDTEVPEDLYVIRSVVYEVGILTDAGNDTDNTNETSEQADFAFFSSGNNGSFIDLSRIPLPIQTNVSGVSVTGVVPASSLAALLFPPANSSGPVPEKQVTVTQNISTTNPEKGATIIANLPKLLGLNKERDDSREREGSGEEKET